jgi:hypothetical protein
MAAESSATFAPMVEVAILVTLYGRALSHANVSSVEQLYGSATEDFWVRHDWINATLTKRITSFSRDRSASSIYGEPMLLLAHVIQQTTTLYLYKTMEPFVIHQDCASRVLDYQRRAISAAREVAMVAKRLASFGTFKVSHTVTSWQRTSYFSYSELKYLWLGSYLHTSGHVPRSRTSYTVR